MSSSGSGDATTLRFARGLGLTGGDATGEDLTFAGAAFFSTTFLTTDDEFLPVKEEGGVLFAFLLAGVPTFLFSFSSLPAPFPRKPARFEGIEAFLDFFFSLSPLVSPSSSIDSSVSSSLEDSASSSPEELQLFFARLFVDLVVPVLRRFLGVVAGFCYFLGRRERIDDSPFPT